jgi:hypothetical protein
MMMSNAHKIINRQTERKNKRKSIHKKYRREDNMLS